MSFFKTSVASCLLGVAIAVNEAPIVPVAAQIGALDFGITCQVPILGNYTFAGFFTATAAIQANAGQEIYYTDLVAEVTIPSSITTLGGLIGARSVDANVKVALDLENASPATFNIFPNGLQINDIKFTPGSPVTVRVPTNGTLQPLGPITMGAAGTTHAIHLGEVDIEIMIPFGPTKFPLDVKCPPQAIPYDCDFSGVIQQEIDLTISGTVPTYLNPGKTFSVDDVYAYLRVPAALTAQVKAIIPEAKTGRVTADNFTIAVKNGSPGAYNALPTPQVVEFEFVDGQEIGIAVPKDETFSIGPLVPGMSGSELFLDAGDASGAVDILDGEGATVITVPFTCVPKYTSSLIGIPVTDLTAPPITP
ncbi:hypothetical protein EJ05DRAFT_497477 [Pseudovirgaria hyperparasitica]|uniref:DUF6801 domain-containing protein n=1 Tax=Pseudovirgaria hyperparasitica TaxID=470096 RepID=A0A6A6WG39_9PEZI|nr:uncharacterized protein EJ05DRAFT_497477 [Pseudovirgaria hyperparasitica]KAF2760906.1 hypothetical protein EJ05DRAFT_497477 [Pseudovirgaria hyperparasitica]